MAETQRLESIPPTPRELQVLHLTADGLTNTEVAGTLDVTVHAVKFHLASIYRKLGVSNRTQAAMVYLRTGDDGLRNPGGH
jgi:DNA-binding NarL/FixJ family response regulator